MRLVRIDHRRCDDYAGTTLVWVDDHMTEGQIQEAVDRAAGAYLKATVEFMEKDKAERVDPINWKNLRDCNVGEVLDEHAKATQLRNEWIAQRRTATIGFDTYLLREEGFHDLWNNIEESYDADWGHRHGTTIDYGEIDYPRFRLIKAVKKGKPGRPVIMIEEEDEWV